MTSEMSLNGNIDYWEEWTNVCRLDRASKYLEYWQLPSADRGEDCNVTKSKIAHSCNIYNSAFPGPNILRPGPLFTIKLPSPAWPVLCSSLYHAYMIKGDGETIAIPGSPEDRKHWNLHEMASPTELCANKCQIMRAEFVTYALYMYKWCADYVFVMVKVRNHRHGMNPCHWLDTIVRIVVLWRNN